MGDEQITNKIFPLSPDPTLSDQGAASIYFEFFKRALESNRIHNIAVTGGFGTGKSSLIRSFDQKKCKEELKEQADGCCFMYVSIGDYSSKQEGKPAKPEEGHGKSDGELDKSGKKSSKIEGKTEEDNTSIRAIERRLLLQLFARFRRVDLPQSSFRLIPEAWNKQLWLIAILLGFFVFSTLILYFHTQLGGLFVAVNSMKGLPKWEASIIAYLVKRKTLLRLLLSVYCIVFGGAASMLLCIRIFPRIRFRGFTVKGANAELSVEREAVESYLDLYSMELVYCLEKIAEKINYVVVFEDLDRLDSGDCIYILTRLREINNLVNLRLQKKSEPLRFIYAVNDDILEAIQHEKFFDYTLPVIPEMNKRSAAVLFAEKIGEIDTSYDVFVEFPQFETVASYLRDYRLQNTILNEYQVLQNLYTRDKNTTDQKATANDKPPALTPNQKSEILALTIYKNCWPGDYHALREYKSQIFTDEGVNGPDNFGCESYRGLLKVLTDPDNHLLTLHSLYYANFSENRLAEMCSKHWKNAIGDPQKHKGIIAELDAIQEDDLECISKVGEVFNSLSSFQTICTDGKSKELHFDLFRAVLKCLVRCKQKDNSWFFSADSYNTCIKLLAGLKRKEDETLKSHFFELSHDNIPDKSNFYAATKTAIEGYGVYSDDELRELCRGMRQIPNEVRIDGMEYPVETNKRVLIIRKEFKDANSTIYFD